MPRQAKFQMFAVDEGPHRQVPPEPLPQDVVDSQKPPTETQGSAESKRTPTSGSTAQRCSTKKSNGSPRHFLTLTLLVVNAVFCWTPVNVAYALLSWASYYDQRFLAISTLVFYLDALLNPLIYPVAAQEWRNAFRRLLRLHP